MRAVIIILLQLAAASPDMGEPNAGVHDRKALTLIRLADKVNLQISRAAKRRAKKGNPHGKDQGQ